MLCYYTIWHYSVHVFIFSEAKPRYCIHFILLREGFSTIAPAKMNGSKPNLAGRNYVTKITHKKIWASIACVAPPRGETAIFLSVHMSPARLIFSERKRPPISASNHVILLLIYAHRQKFRIFLRVGGGGSKKGDFRDFGCGCFVGRLQPTQNTRFARKKHGLLAEMS